MTSGKWLHRFNVYEYLMGKILIQSSNNNNYFFAEKPFKSSTMAKKIQVRENENLKINFAGFL